MSMSFFAASESRDDAADCVVIWMRLMREFSAQAGVGELNLSEVNL